MALLKLVARHSVGIQRPSKKEFKVTGSLRDDDSLISGEVFYENSFSRKIKNTAPSKHSPAHK
jgi:hypothetical protein